MIESWLYQTYLLSRSWHPQTPPSSRHNRITASPLNLISLHSNLQDKSNRVLVIPNLLWCQILASSNTSVIESWLYQTCLLSRSWHPQIPHSSSHNRTTASPLFSLSSNLHNKPNRVLVIPNLLWVQVLASSNTSVIESWLYQTYLLSQSSLLKHYKLLVITNLLYVWYRPTPLVVS